MNREMTFYRGIRSKFFVVHKVVAQPCNFLHTKWVQLRILQVHLKMLLKTRI